MEAQGEDSSSLNEKVPEMYPINTKPLENQVAGHRFNDGHCTIGMLRDEEGSVLKPVNHPEQGQREIQFYETLLKSSTEEILQMKQFVPEYLGSVTLSIEGRSKSDHQVPQTLARFPKGLELQHSLGKVACYCMLVIVVHKSPTLRIWLNLCAGVQFLRLMDATRGYEKPCVMDVKIGRQTWEPGAPEGKRLKEEAKYIFCKQECGFCIPGFQVFNITTGVAEKYGKDYGKKLKREDIPNVLKKFLNNESGRGRAVAEEILRQLNTILGWWRVQRLFHIYSSSILLTYDAAVLSEHNIVDNNQLTSRVRVILIDFAHVLPANGSPDLNYLSGLETFVQIFSSVLNEL